MLKGILATTNIAPHIKQNIRALADSNLLLRVFTTFYYHPDYPLTSFLGFFSSNLKRDFKRRSLEATHYSLIKGKPVLEICRTIASKTLNAKITDFIWQFNEHLFGKWVSRKLSKKTDFVFVSEYSSLEILKKATKLAITSIYEQPSIHHSTFTKIIDDQLRKYPDLISESFKLVLDDKSKLRNARRDEELSLANLIICNSNFTKNSLIDAGVKPSKITVIPLGFPEVIIGEPKKTDIFIFMYAGNLSFNKGIHILVEAWKELNLAPNKAELHLYGTYFLPEKLRQGLPKNVHFFGNVQHQELMSVYKRANVFVNPTLADGFGMVITEAMANGLPVLASRNSAAPDLIEDTVDGLLMEGGNKNELIEKKLWCYQHSDDLLEMGSKARVKAQRYTWSDYRKALVETLESKFN